MIREVARDYQGAVICEVGVAFGDFSAVMLDAFKPREFVAIDSFVIHQMPLIWGAPPSERFGAKTHLQFYEDRFQHHPIRAIQGDSSVALAKFPDEYFDMIYIDADHIYAGVRKDAWVADKKLKPNGVLVFNDYIMFDHNSGDQYGVVQNVNELIDSHGYEVIGFALQRDMFADIAVRRATAGRMTA